MYIKYSSILCVHVCAGGYGSSHEGGGGAISIGMMKSAVPLLWCDCCCHADFFCWIYSSWVLKIRDDDDYDYSY